MNRYISLYDYGLNLPLEIPQANRVAFDICLVVRAERSDALGSDWATTANQHCSVLLAGPHALYSFQTITPRGVPFDYQHFPGVAHACFVRGDGRQAGEREAMARGKNAALSWLRQFLRDP